jgi:cell division protein FtsI (penicillin-binding protein 3)
MKAVPTVFQRRIVIGAVICVLAFALVGARLIDVTLFIPDAKVGKPGIVGEVSRGDLVDRNGELVARDLPADDLYARPHLFSDKRLAARRLASVTGADERRLMQMFASKRAYVLVARQLSPEVRAEVQRLGLPGLEYEPDSKRHYPDGRMTAQVVGVADPDGNGVSGLELGLDSQLRGERPGEPVQTSLDTRVQFVLAHEAAVSMKEFSARAAGGLVMDVRTGEILALVSLPDFDPNARVFVTGHPPAQHHSAGRLRTGFGLQDILLHAGARGPYDSGPRRTDSDRQRLQDRQVYDPRSRASALHARRSRCAGAVFQHRHG